MIDARGIISRAANIVDGDNPRYTVGDFRKIMPMFTPEIVPCEVMEHYVNMANAVVKEARWHEQWREAMRLYIAHFLTLYVQTTAEPAAGKAGIINAGSTRGVATSKSVGGVSVSFDINVANGDLPGWAEWKLTTYGTQYATMAKLLGKGGMVVR